MMFSSFWCQIKDFRRYKYELIRAKHQETSSVLCPERNERQRLNEHAHVCVCEAQRSMQPLICMCLSEVSFQSYQPRGRLGGTAPQTAPNTHADAHARTPKHTRSPRSCALAAADDAAPGVLLRCPQAPPPRSTRSHGTDADCYCPARTCT